MPAYRLYFFISAIHKHEFLSKRVKSKLKLMEMMNVDVEATTKYFESLQLCYNFESASDEDKFEYVYT